MKKKPESRFLLISLCVLTLALNVGCASSEPDTRNGILNVFIRETATLPMIASARPTRTPTVTPTPVFTASATATATLTVTPHPIYTPTKEFFNVAALPTAPADKLTLLEDMTIPDGEIIERGALMIKSWRIKNNGGSVWNENYRLIRAQPYPLEMPQNQKAIFLQPTELIEAKLMTWNARQSAVAPGLIVDLVVPLRIPESAGEYLIEYNLVNDQNELVPPRLWVKFEVPFTEAELTATVEESLRLSETPNPNEESERPALGTVMPVEVKSIDWTGKWLIRDPYIAENTVPIEAEFSQDGQQLTGYFYDSDGEPVLIDGALSDNHHVFTGRIGRPWETKQIDVRWRMLLSGDQFSAITENGLIDFGTSCGSRNGLPFPDYCAIPPGV